MKKWIELIENTDEIKKIIFKPHIMPYKKRKEIAEILAYELYTGTKYEIKDLAKFRERLGYFDLILNELHNWNEWQEIKKETCANEVVSAEMLKRVLPIILNRFSFLKKQETDELAEKNVEFNSIIEEFQKLLTFLYQLWNRRIEDFKDLLTELNGKAIEQISYDVKDREQKEDLLKAFLDSSEALRNNTLKGDFFNFLLNKDEFAELLEWMRRHKTVLKILQLLFPGRRWDFSIMDLYHHYFANLEKYAELLEKNADLTRIIDLLGKIEFEEGEKTLEITPRSTSELFGVTLSNDIARLLPIELIKLSNHYLQYVFFAKWLEKGLLTYQLRGKHWTGGPPKILKRGPVVALVDTSGSMHGSPEHISKAIILAVVRKMFKEKRDVKIILFASKNQTTEIILTDKERMAREFLDFLNYSFGGGTDFNTALSSGLNSVQDKKFEYADILFISDGLSEISDKNLIQKWQNWKTEKKGRIFSIIAGNDYAGGLQDISDYVFLLTSPYDWSIKNSPARMIKLFCVKEIPEEMKKGIDYSIN